MQGAGTGPSSSGALDRGVQGGEDDIAAQFWRLQASIEAEVRMLSQKEEAIKQAEAAISVASQRMNSLSSRFQSDIISLNVGGTLLATSRRTLTLVPDSLLGTMFSGAWDDHLRRDDAGRVFLDYDPSVFALLLNWLRSQDMGGPEAPLWELQVEAEREEQLLVLIDFLQLQRFVPCSFNETFAPGLSSPFLTLAGRSAWRTAAGPRGAYAVGATCHAYFDVDVELHLEVLRFGAVSRPVPPTGRAGRGGRGARAGGRGGGRGRSPSNSSEEDDNQLPDMPMFVGVIARSQLAGLDQSRRKSNASWQATCHGWWTRRRQTCEVREGKSKRLQRLQGQALWSEGDSLMLRLDAAKHPDRLLRPLADAPAPAQDQANQQQQQNQQQNQRRGVGAGVSAGGPRLTLTNTRTTARLQLDIAPDCLGEFEEQWVVIVGLAGCGDEVRLNSARRRGRKPLAEYVTQHLPTHQHPHPQETPTAPRSALTQQHQQQPHQRTQQSGEPEGPAGPSSSTSGSPVPAPAGGVAAGQPGAGAANGSGDGRSDRRGAGTSGRT